MKKLICIAMLALCPLAVAVADDRHDGHKNDAAACTANGAWYGGETGEDGVFRITYVVNYIPGDTDTGSFVLDVPGLPLSAFPPAARASMARGFWNRVSATEFTWVALVVTTTAEGAPAYVLKLRGPVTLARPCTEMTIGTFVDVYLPEMNPFEDDPLQTIPMGTTVMHPMQAKAHRGH